LRNKIPYVNNFLFDNSIDVLSLAETKILDISLPCIVGYNLYRSDRSNKGGGVAIYVKACLNSKLCPMILEQDDCVENLSVTVQLSQFISIIVTNLYRPKFTLNNDDIKTIEIIVEYYLLLLFMGAISPS